jgi:hypothetical protein
LVQAANGILPEFFEGVKGFSSKTQLNTQDLHFEESYKRNLETTRADAGGWFVALIIFMRVFAVILSSVAHWYYKKEQAKRVSEKREKNRQLRQSAASSSTSIEHVIDNSPSDDAGASPAQ